jgi:hypothetical protein
MRSLIMGFLPGLISEEHMKTCLTEKNKKKYTMTQEYLNIASIENLKS